MPKEFKHQQRPQIKDYEKGWDRVFGDVDVYDLGDAIRRAYIRHGNDSWVSIARDVKEEFTSAENAQTINSDRRNT